MKQNSRNPGVEKTERKAQEEEIEDGIVDQGGELRAEPEAEDGVEPLGEGADVGAEEGVDRVEEGVVGAEPAAAEGGQRQARTHGVHEVRTRARHGCTCSHLGFGRGVVRFKSLSFVVCYKSGSAIDVNRKAWWAITV